MQRKLRALTLTTGAAALTLTMALTGCGDDSSAPAPKGDKAQKSTPDTPKKGPKGSEVMDEAMHNMQDLKSVTIKGDLQNQGENIKLDGHGSLEDKGDFDLKLTVPMSGSPVSMEIISKGGEFYMGGSDEFFKQAFSDNQAVISKTHGKFLKVPEDQKSMTQGMTLKELMDKAFGTQAQSFDNDKLENADAPGKLTELDGVKAYEYSLKDDKTKLYLSTDGKNQLVGMDAGSDGRVTLADHNEETAPVEAPSDDKVVTQEDLMKAMGQ